MNFIYIGTMDYGRAWGIRIGQLMLFYNHQKFGLYIFNYRIKKG
jgi:hypothetical protein